MVITFKHKLKLVLKDDLYQRETYEKSVKTIHDLCVTYTEWLQGSLEFDMLTIGKFVAMVETLACAIDVYVDNKFSPASAGLLHPKLDDMRKHTTVIADIFHMMIEVNDTINDKSKTIDSESVKALRETYDEYCSKIHEQLDMEIYCLLSILQYMDIVVTCDLNKINMGVDPIREYRKRLKRLPNKKNFIPEFHIQFKVLSKSDREFLEKEKVKNAQRRN